MSLVLEMNSTNFIFREETMKKKYLVIISLLSLFLIGAKSQAPKDENEVKAISQVAIQKYLKSEHDSNIKSKDIEIKDLEKKKAYRTKSKNKKMKHTWFVEAQADDVTISAWIDIPSKKKFSITFFNYGIKNEINDIKKSTK